nr:type IVB secretion system protein IcmH/DotU [uncultured Pseudomonas sp.]
MTKQIQYSQDDRTVLLNQDGERPSHEPLTDFARPPQFVDLEQRLVYATRPQTHHSFNISINPLVAAASPLLSAIIEIKSSAKPDALSTLKDGLVAHLRHFETRSLEGGVEQSEVMMARYVLCTVTDEAVVTTSWGSNSQWSDISLLSSFHNETSGGEKFFLLLENMSRNPMKHLGMLELMYICMSLGFEGKFRVQTRGNVELDAIRDGTYRQIRQLRGDVPRELSPHWAGLTGGYRGVVRMVPWWLVTALTGICLVVMFSGFAYVLGDKRESVLQRYLPADPTVAEAMSTFREIK